jgi:hypothetical protein
MAPVTRVDREYIEEEVEVGIQWVIVERVGLPN